MAKVRSILKLSGTLAATTFVDSKAYGAHARAKRGTYTPISLAEGMKKSAVVQTKVNLLAKIVFDAVNDFAPGFKDGKFWSRLLTVFRQQQKAEKIYNYGDFNQLEMRLDYPTSKHGTFWLVKTEKDSVLLHYQIAKNQGTWFACFVLQVTKSCSHLMPVRRKRPLLKVTKKWKL